MTEPSAAPERQPFLDNLGDRVRRRAEPRASVAVAGAGCALGVLGVLIISGDTGSSDDGFSQWPGVVLCAAVVAAGYFVLARHRSGALATGGVVAAVLGIPPLLVFLTWSDSDLPPYSTEGILIISTAVWLCSYALGPGKGRLLFLGAGLFGLWFTLLQLAEQAFDAPFTFFGGWFAYAPNTSLVFDDMEAGGQDVFGGGFGPSIDLPDPTTLGIISLLFGVGYIVVARALDGRGYRGTATAFTVAGLPALYSGAFMLSGELEAAGTGLLLMVTGVLLAFHGGSVWRRATTWIGGAFTTIGAGVFLSDMTDDAIVGGLLFLAAGMGLVFAGHAWAVARDEPDEMLVTHPPQVGDV